MGRLMTEDLLMLTGAWLIAVGFVLLIWAYTTFTQNKNYAISFIVAGIVTFVWGGALLCPPDPIQFGAGISIRITSNDR
jgi:uncharacterized membrane protein